MFNVQGIFSAGGAFPVAPTYSGSIFCRWKKTTSQLSVPRRPLFRGSTVLGIPTQTMNEAYKQRLSALANLVLVMFEDDTMVQPKESEVRKLYSPF